MNIAICDNDRVAVRQIERMVFDFFVDKDINFEIYPFTSAKEMLGREVEYDLAFIDIEMPGMNGLELAKKLNERNSYTIIMIVTSFNHYLDDAMELSVYRYISKPIDRSRFNANLSAALKKHLNTHRPVLIKNNDEISKVNSCDVIYLSFEGRKVHLHTRSCVIEVSGTLDYWKNLLGDACFYQVSRSHVVNLNYVISVNKSNVILKCGEATHEIKVSSRIYAPLKRAFHAFLGGS